MLFECDTELAGAPHTPVSVECSGMSENWIPVPAIRNPFIGVPPEMFSSPSGVEKTSTSSRIAFALPDACDGGAHWVTPRLKEIAGSTRQHIRTIIDL